MKKLFFLLLPLFAGCAELDRLTNAPLEMAIELKAPENSEAQLQVNGRLTSETYYDNGTGLSSKMVLWPGEYEASLNRIEKGPLHYQGILNYSNSNGNISREERLKFWVRQEDADKLRLQGVYQPITGSLDIAVSGLPLSHVLQVRYADVSGDVQSFPINEPPALKPGKYELYFDPVQLQGNNYLPDRPQEIVDVKAGEFVSISVTYTQEVP